MFLKQCKKFEFIPLARCSCYDVTVIGGGIIGTSIAKTIKEKIEPSKVVLVEKEDILGKHQSSCNSNVIHAGIYYKPDSLKAKLCVKGLDLIYDYCDDKNIPINKCGKLIVARNKLDIYRLKHLKKQSLDNGISGVEILTDWTRVQKIQPNCKGLQALWSPNTGNVDWQVVTRSFGDDFLSKGGKILFESEVLSLKENSDCLHPISVEIFDKNCPETKTLLTKFVIICMGLNSGKLYASSKKNDASNFKHMSLRVNYSLLNPTMNSFIKMNIYAMPVIGMPFLGVHISPKVDGSVLLGPAAVPAFQSEGYNNNEIDTDYIKNLLGFPGFHLMVIKNFWINFNQFSQTICKESLTDELKLYFPMISKVDVLQGPSAVQAQLIDDNGDFVDDFLIDIFEGSGIEKRIVNCRFIPSPGATSSLAIAEMVTSELVNVFSE